MFQQTPTRLYRFLVPQVEHVCGYFPKALARLGPCLNQQRFKKQRTEEKAVKMQTSRDNANQRAQW